MARIRTIKPEFFRHEGLQDLEAKQPALRPMLVFAALFGHADKTGVFEWRPRMLKLDILPFLEFDIALTLDALKAAGFVQQFEAGGKQYGLIPTFNAHQRIEGKEREAPGKHPSPVGDTTGNQPEVQEGKGREGKGRERAHSHPAPDDFVLTDERKRYAESKGLVGVVEQFDQFLDHHKAKGSRFMDWNAAWQTWVRNGVRFQAKDRGPQRRVDRRAD